MHRCPRHIRRHLGGLLALSGIMIVFVCLPAEFFLIVLGMGMVAVGVILLDM